MTQGMADFGSLTPSRNSRRPDVRLPQRIAAGSLA